jgi:hypothetical protein
MKRTRDDADVSKTLTELDSDDVQPVQQQEGAGKAQRRKRLAAGCRVSNTAAATSEYSLAQAATQLARDGVAVMPIPGIDVSKLRERMFDMVDKEFVEYQPSYVSGGGRVGDTIRPLVMGGFAALGNPSSFHNSLVRELRLTVHPHAKDLVCAMLADEAFVTTQCHSVKYNYFTQEIDRLMLRPSGVAPSAEAWHRDESPHAKPTDIVFGGWLNLDEAPQYFSCQLRSHVFPGQAAAHKADTSGVGFKPIVDKQRIAELRASKTLVEVPSGALLVFVENIIHEVLPRKQPYVSMRLFMGWRVSREPCLLVDDLDNRLLLGAVIPLKSGQMPPMYARMHRVNWMDRLREFSTAAFAEDVLAHVGVKDEDVRLVPRVMKSLDGYGLIGYMKPYAEDELAVLRPAFIAAMRK